MLRTHNFLVVEPKIPPTGSVRLTIMD